MGSGAECFTPLMVMTSFAPRSEAFSTPCFHNYYSCCTCAYDDRFQRHIRARHHTTAAAAANLIIINSSSSKSSQSIPNPLFQYTYYVYIFIFFFSISIFTFSGEKCSTSVALLTLLLGGSPINGFRGALKWDRIRVAR